MKKTVLTLAAFALVAAAGYGATRAYFTDTEVSEGNTFTAGTLDLLVGIENRGDLNPDPRSPISLDNNQALFNFEGILPGQTGSGHYKLQANQDVYACISTDITDGAGTAFADDLRFAFFEDENGDGVWNVGERGPNLGTGSGFTAAELDAFGFAGIAHKPSQPNLSLLGTVPMLADIEYDLGYAYCFGEMGFTGTEITCNGASVGNDAQGQSVVGTVSFVGVQAAYNDDFSCESLNPVFAVTQDSGKNADNKANNRPYVDYTVNGHLVEVEFVNPTNHSFAFFYRIDDEAGTPGTWSDTVIGEGELSGELIGPYYNVVNPGAHGSTTLTLSGNEKIEVGLRLGAEQNWFFDWIVFENQN